MYTQDYDETTPLQQSKEPGLPSGGYWYFLIQPYVKSYKLMLCPDRDFVLATKDQAKNPADVNGQALGYGYNDGWISDSCLGLTCQQRYPNSTKTFRAGQPISEIDSPANCVAFGDTNDTPGYSIAMDNELGAADAPAGTSKMRHHGTYNFAFVDGHAKPIMMEVGTYLGNIATRPKSETDALKWCRRPNAVPDSSFSSDFVPNPTDTCQTDVHNFYTSSWITIP